MLELSLIIISRNKSQITIDCLNSILKSKFPRNKYEIILVDDGSNTNEAKRLQEYTQNQDSINLLLQKNRGFAAARNQGIKSSKGSILLFLDPKGVANKHLLENHYIFHKKNPTINTICQGVVSQDTKNKLESWLSNKSYLFDDLIGFNLYFKNFENKSKLDPTLTCFKNISLKKKLIKNIAIDPWQDTLEGENIGYFLNLNSHIKLNIILNKSCKLTQTKHLKEEDFINGTIQHGRIFTKLKKKYSDFFKIPNKNLRYILVITKNKGTIRLIKKISKVLWPKTNSLYNYYILIKYFFLGLNEGKRIK